MIRLQRHNILGRSSLILRFHGLLLCNSFLATHRKIQHDSWPNPGRKSFTLRSTALCTVLLYFTLCQIYTQRISKTCSLFISPYPRSSHIEIGVQNQAPSEGAQRQIAKGLLWSQFLLAQAESILNFSPAEASHWHLGAAGVTVSRSPSLSHSEVLLATWPRTNATGVP